MKYATLPSHAKEFLNINAGLYDIHKCVLQVFACVYQVLYPGHICMLESMKNVCPFLHMSTTPLYMACQRSQHSTYIPVHAKHCDGLPSKNILHSDTAGHNSVTGSGHLVCCCTVHACVKLKGDRQIWRVTQMQQHIYMQIQDST